MAPLAFVTDDLMSWHTWIFDAEPQIPSFLRHRYDRFAGFNFDPHLDWEE
jgi:hypothetical protein